MDKFETWDDWEFAVDARGPGATMHESLHLMFGMAHLSTTEATDDQLNLFKFVSNRTLQQVESATKAH
jgi:hypothetical protein